MVANFRLKFESIFKVDLCRGVEALYSKFHQIQLQFTSINDQITAFPSSANSFKNSQVRATLLLNYLLNRDTRQSEKVVRRK